MDLTNADVQDILHLLDGLPFSELSLETARFRLSLRRGADGGWAQALEVLGQPNVLPTASDQRAATEPLAEASSAGEDSSAENSAAEAGSGADLTDVRTPLLGTFYRAPRPGAPPFVTVGAVVAPDTVVGIIETMKLMNSVTAGVSGAIAEIVLADGEFAEQGTVLMRIRSQR
ncbi:MAG TPA: biotin/lipoyl-containing protein [Streptosporangiaceae bacterium]|nr:biotin/lipoyl-containing protein [Streptosporangiaceae bacterium]